MDSATEKSATVSLITNLQTYADNVSADITWLTENATDYHKTASQSTHNQIVSVVLLDTFFKILSVTWIYLTAKHMHQTESAADALLVITWQIQEHVPLFQKDVQIYQAVKDAHLVLLDMSFKEEFVIKSTQIVSCMINQQSNVANALLITFSWMASVTNFLQIASQLITKDSAHLVHQDLSFKQVFVTTLFKTASPTVATVAFNAALVIM